MSRDEYRQVGAAVATPVIDGVPVAQGRRVVELEAPAALAGGYLLSAEVDGSTVTVCVPDGGVMEGERFLGEVVGTPSKLADMDIPRGQWRDGLCDCCRLNACGPLNWLACCCTPIALAQVMTRLRLDWFGGYQGTERSYTFKTVVIVFLLVVAIDQILTQIYGHLMGEYVVDPTVDVTIDMDDQVVEPTSAFIVKSINRGVRLVFGLYILIAMVRTRAYIRQQYGITERCCAGCEDCCCSFWCACCTVTQMARHTADYHKYPAACCSEDGLPPPVV